MEIKEFRGEYRFLSNFWLTPVSLKGKDNKIYEFNSAEHAYQSIKARSRKDFDRIRNAKTPGQAKKDARFIKMKADFQDRRLEYMEMILRAKFANPVMKKKLLDTGDATLEEGNGWNDTFWGICREKGENNLGKLLMKLRKEYLHRNATGRSRRNEQRSPKVARYGDGSGKGES